MNVYIFECDLNKPQLQLDQDLYQPIRTILGKQKDPHISVLINNLATNDDQLPKQTSTELTSQTIHNHSEFSTFCVVKLRSEFQFSSRTAVINIGSEEKDVGQQ